MKKQNFCSAMLVVRVMLMVVVLSLAACGTATAQFSNNVPGVITNTTAFNTNPPAAVPQPVSVWGGTNANPNGLYAGGMGSVYNQFDATGTNFVQAWVKQTAGALSNWVATPSGGNVVTTAFYSPATNFIFGGALATAGSTNFMIGNGFTNTPGFTNLQIYVYGENLAPANNIGFTGPIFNFWAKTNQYSYDVWIWTNSLNSKIVYFIPQLLDAGMATTMDIALNSYQSHANAKNGLFGQYDGYFTNFWNGAGQLTPIALLTLGTMATERAQVTQGSYSGSFNGPVNAGDLGVNTHMVMSDQGSPLPPVDPNWNAFSRPVPTLSIPQWPNMYDDFTFTNTMLYAMTNGILIDLFYFDLSWTSVTNGQFYWTTGSSSGSQNPWGYNTTNNLPLTNYVAWLASSNIDSDLALERYTNFSSLTYPSSYNFSTPAQLKAQVAQLMGAGFKAVSVDHLLLNNTGIAPSDPGVNQTELAFPAALYNAVLQARANTNLVANNQTSANLQKFGIQIMAFSQFDYDWSVANTIMINDVVLADNGLPGGPFSGATAEANYVQFVHQNTNSYSYVRPGHHLWAGDIDSTTANFDATNQFNLATLLACDISVISWGRPWNAGVFNISTNAEWKAVLQDKRVRMALPVTNWPSGSATVELWAGAMDGSGKYKIGLWNHSGSATTTVSFPAALLDPMLTGSVLVRDPEQRVNLETGPVITISNIPPYAIWLYTVTPYQPPVAGPTFCWACTPFFTENSIGGTAPLPSFFNGGDNIIYGIIRANGNGQPFVTVPSSVFQGGTNVVVGITIGSTNAQAWTYNLNYNCLTNNSPTGVSFASFANTFTTAPGTNVQEFFFTNRLSPSFTNSVRSVVNFTLSGINNTNIWLIGGQFNGQNF